MQGANMRPYQRISVGCVVVVLVLAIASLKPADATLQCQGNFQITKYGPIDTPYCEEEQIAIVAQSQGWHVSASEIHNKPLKKIEVCTALAGDARLKGSCPVRAKRGG
jgi:hypothetical protein